MKFLMDMRLIGIDDEVVGRLFVNRVGVGDERASIERE